MGSISKRPVAPSVTTPTPSSSGVVITPSVVTPTVDPVTVAKEKETARVEEREQNLLRRNRGFLGTILTGFQGVLNNSQEQPRKTLLGE